MSEDMPGAAVRIAAKPARRGLRRTLLVLVPLATVLLALGLYLRGGRFVETENAYVKADKLFVSAEIAGAISDVLVQDNDRIEPGQILFRIDDASYRIALARAQARIAQVRTDLNVLRASYGEKQAAIAIAKTRLAFAMRERERASNLRERNFLSAARLDDAQQAAELARQEVLSAEQELHRIAESLGGGIERPMEQHPNFLAALAERDQARLDLERVVVRSPLAGIVVRAPQSGQHVAPGSAAMSLLVTSKYWVEANIPETELTYVKSGQPVRVRIDTYPDVEWQGTVDELGPATGAEFSLIPAQNATGNWVKITQRVPVRIRLERGAADSVLRAGLSAHVAIDTGRRRSLFGHTWPQAW